MAAGPNATPPAWDGECESEGNRRLILDDQNLAALERAGLNRHLDNNAEPAPAVASHGLAKPIKDCCPARSRAIVVER